jgi:hypothetical protein
MKLPAFRIKDFVKLQKSKLCHKLKKIYLLLLNYFFNQVFFLIDVELLYIATILTNIFLDTNQKSAT